MHSMRTLLTSVVAALAFAKSVYPFTPTFPYGSEKVRGVNLGGWLVLEVCAQRCYKCPPQQCSARCVALDYSKHL